VLSERRLRTAAFVLAMVGLAIATYIAIEEAGGGAAKCVAGGGGCEKVADSEYSELVGINIAVIGIFGYAVLALAAVFPGDPGRFAGLVASLFGFGFSLYLTYLELFEIDAICQWCVASAVIMTLLFAVNLLIARRYLGAGPPAEGPG
jgi:uncharacterized membrane protein